MAHCMPLAPDGGGNYRDWGLCDRNAAAAATEHGPGPPAIGPLPQDHGTQCADLLVHRPLQTQMGRRRVAIPMKAMTTWLLGGLLAIVVAGCSGSSLGAINPLSGTWYFVTRSPTLKYTGTIEFDYNGDAERMAVTSTKGTQRYVFNGKPYAGDNGDYETATATTTLTDDDLHVKARVEHTKGEYKGVTYITVEATVHFGEMSGTIEIDPPNDDPSVFTFDATRH
jgi:hypothetical protein